MLVDLDFLCPFLVTGSTLNALDLYMKYTADVVPLGALREESSQTYFTVQITGINFEFELVV